MKILIAPDSFKECLAAKDVVSNISKGILQVIPEAELYKIPMSDGGEGLLEVFIEGLGGHYNKVIVQDPLMRNITAKYGLLHDKKTAVIEMAKASGLELLSEDEKNPLITSTYGTGQLIKDALDKGCKRIIIGIGGSATNDAGVGMLKALGCQFLDKKGNTVPEGGGYLDRLSAINIATLDSRIIDCEITVACDVDNPLTGEKGASIVYGAQKGASAEAIHKLDNSLKHFAAVLASHINKDFSTTPGAGAAGGMGLALLAVLNGKLEKGIDLVVESLKLEAIIKKVDLVFTGEGKIDKQTLHGKTISGIAKIAHKYNTPLIVFTGKIGPNIEEIYTKGVSAVHSIINTPMSLEEAIEKAPQLLQHCARNVMGTIEPFTVNKELK